MNYNAIFIDDSYFRKYYIQCIKEHLLTVNNIEHTFLYPQESHDKINTNQRFLVLLFRQFIPSNLTRTSEKINEICLNVLKCMIYSYKVLVIQSFSRYLTLKIGDKITLPHIRWCLKTEQLPFLLPPKKLHHCLYLVS